ncbi:hypothetical protein ACQKQD_32355 [Methylobacterium sp. NPDC080182]|uniref:hypothetical protein n=1 Tax=Methylobacterium sp. NPDC080182 TaxID=3390590 RepID=UPI003CFF5A22
MKQVIRRLQIDGDQRGEVHLTLCEHALNDRPPRLYLHLHTFVRRSQDLRKPVAFNARQLGALIAQLRELQDEMEAGKPVASTASPDASEPPRRVRGRRPGEEMRVGSGSPVAEKASDAG